MYPKTATKAFDLRLVFLVRVGLRVVLGMKKRRCSLCDHAGISHQLFFVLPVNLLRFILNHCPHVCREDGFPGPPFTNIVVEGGN
jgi:hypothetical protein